ncbi:helix-hairpin-helix domain-containing protein [Luteibacter flocculans]|uniref:Helix-hairpin-helix domain-containing protein n=1 Tax=Luteibacter flocculans TaxID=2780091 RepID=A0ABY4SX66_9GAMM|nr:helix-hairpin-helix domain-containing protein [Luteibacter flocculans]
MRKRLVGSKADCSSDDSDAPFDVVPAGCAVTAVPHVLSLGAPVRGQPADPQSDPASFDASSKETLLKRYLIALAGLLLSPLALASTPVNINTADAATLAESLDGVGLVKAQAIVAWREANGAFENADQLAQVKGIGASLVDRNRDAIQVDGGKTVKKAKAPKTPRARAGGDED